MRDTYSTECPKCGGAINLGLADLEGLEDDIESETEAARQDGYDDGHDAGRDAGYQDAKDELPEPDDARTTDLRAAIYRAIYAGDIGAAQDAADLMAMVDIDRELIWSARGKDRG